MILFHADDYGINCTQSKRILSCYTGGCLNSVSLLVTSPEASACSAMLPEDISLRLHLNFREGVSLCDPSQIPLLVDEKGYFCRSFGELFLLSLLRRRLLKRQLKRETRRQILRMQELMGKEIPIRIDSHGHYHMIPLVWDALFETCREMKVEIDELRVPAEPWGPLLKDPLLLFRAPGSGILKNMIMHVLYAYNRMKGKHPGHFDFDRRVPVFFGMVFTTRMTRTPVKRLLPSFKRLAQASGRDLELMFHPGGLSEKETIWDERFRDFHRSPNRRKEAMTLRFLKDGEGIAN